MTQTITVDASPIGGVIIQGGSAPNLPVPLNGRVTASPAVAAQLVSAGANYVSTQNRAQNLQGPPVAATAGRIVASTTLANGTLSIANQPDIPRQGVVVVDPGTSAITAGVLSLAYVGNDSLTRTEAISLVGPGTTIMSTTTSRGMVTVSSAIVTALAGGASPKVQINDTNALALSVDPYFTAFSISRQFGDGVATSGGTVASTAACFTPTLTPNATHTYGFAYSYVAP